MSCVLYASAVESLMYAMVCTRPNIAHTMEFLSRYTSKPWNENWTTIDMVFKYLCGATTYGLCYQGIPRLDVHGFVDVDWDGDMDHKISISGYVSNLFGGEINWMSKRQFVVALSTIEYEYMPTTHARKEAIWLHRLCSSIGFVQQVVRVDCDS
jgi:hypothetical protein